MNKSILLYKELLKLSSSPIKEYLKNVPTFENQLIFNELSEKCYQELYENINPEDIAPPLSEYFSKINGLQEINKLAYSYYMRPRNKSIKGYDVQLGKKFEELFSDFLKLQKINVERADLKNRSLPDLMVLDKTRNISAYLELKYHNAPFMLSHKIIKRESYEGSITLDTKKLKKQIIEVEANIVDRPVYIVHWVDFHHIKGIFFNTLEQIKDYLEIDSVEFKRKQRGEYNLIHKDKYTEKFYPPLHEMGNFEELIKNLKN